ncbi:phosphomannomutase [Vibrio breoganii]|uniref:phosphomannomutase n=1 Tax=Vibrio breoganii TaxID=553239 RepID=UPI00080EA326|nr:phosphomannomutase [Vibrio breoganii]OCH75367.1 phosphomannomutase [Vibrio breoganii]PML15739.1 phosphomannomutase [Vibrio breoganii]
MPISVKVIQESGVQFGTSGARGLVEQFSSDVCAAFTHAFIDGIKESFEFDTLALAIDNRPSSYAMAQACSEAAKQAGLRVIYYGVVPTPTLAYVAMQQSIPCVMVTGSHIPFDRNGLKFYRPDGEISKADEKAILTAEVEFKSVTDLPELGVSPFAAQEYTRRYTSLFDAEMLSGKRIGIYEHSSAGRDIYAGLFESLGAEVISLERTNEFVPIDTEAVADVDKAKAKAWSKKHNLDFIFSTDGDGDRPLVGDENGEWLRGDILGLLCSQEMGIDALAIPVSCNTIIEQSSAFKTVSKTKIGSPYVIAEFEALSDNFTRIAGFEANGGFLLGSDVEINGKVLKALPTRDAVLPALMLLSAAQTTSIAKLVSDLPQRFSHSDRIQNFATEKSVAILAYGTGAPQSLLSDLGFDEAFEKVDTTDGLRMTLSSGVIVHLRPSGNAPELRCYAEADSMEEASAIVEFVLNKVQDITIPAQ